MKCIHRYGVVVGLALILCVPCAAIGMAGEPMDALRKPVEEVIAVLRDPQYGKDGSQSLLQERISVLTHQIFDYTEMAKRSLAQHWRTFTPEQRKSFTEAFAQLLENTYTSKVQGQYNDEVVTFLSQEKLSDSVARVKTKITGKSWEIPVDYSMHLSRVGWRIYDVNIEGVSLVMNYRNQFRNILAKESPDQLIERVRNKLTE